ncbi:MAG TPA: serine/threonine protein phosphatase, partial [Cellvibrionaceae bacterium]
YPDEWRDHLEWFTRLPLYRQYPYFRVTHACWDAKAIARHEQAGHTSHLGQAGLMALADPQSAIARLTKRLTTGVEIALPNEAAMLTAEGYLRHNFRARFWGDRPHTYGDCVFQPDPIAPEIAEKPLSDQQQQALVLYDSAEPILFIGHYWLNGIPQPIAPNIACLDYSAVKFGRLVAYRMDQESVVDPQKFVWVYVDP